jgi:hypothetical protein
MTRQQVAKRLGKSLVTVRRLEGGCLHPRQDSRGVHHFRTEEVEALVEDIEQGRISLWQELWQEHEAVTADERFEECDGCTALRKKVKALRGQFDEQSADHQRAIESLEHARARERAKYESEAHELVDRLEGLLEVLEG